MGRLGHLGGSAGEMRCRGCGAVRAQVGLPTALERVCPECGAQAEVTRAGLSRGQVSFPWITAVSFGDVRNAGERLRAARTLSDVLGRGQGRGSGRT